MRENATKTQGVFVSKTVLQYPSRNARESLKDKDKATQREIQRDRMRECVRERERVCVCERETDRDRERQT